MTSLLVYKGFTFGTCTQDDTVDKESRLYNFVQFYESGGVAIGRGAFLAFCLL